MDSKKELNTIKAIVKYKRYVFLLTEYVDKIYFDTYGEYSFLKETNDKSDWTVKYFSSYDTDGNKLFIYGSKGSYKIQIPTTPFTGFQIINKNNFNILFEFKCIKKDVYETKFNKTFSYDDAIYITDRIIKELWYSRSIF